MVPVAAVGSAAMETGIALEDAAEQALPSQRGETAGGRVRACCRYSTRHPLSSTPIATIQIRTSANVEAPSPIHRLQFKAPSPIQGTVSEANDH